MDMNAFLNTAVGRQFKAMAEQRVAQRKVERSGYQEELNGLLSKGNTRHNIAPNRGEVRFVKMEGVLSFYQVSDNGKVKDIKPMTTETFQGLEDFAKSQFKEKFPAEAMALEYNSFKQDLSQDFFTSAVVSQNTDYKEMEMYHNRPKVQHDMDFHKNPDVYNSYDSFEDYKKGLTKELKSYQEENSVEGRIQRQNRIDELKGKISEINTEIGGNGE
jgi:hypothetical protein